MILADALALIQEVKRLSPKLSAWERGFLRSVEGQQYSPTPKQSFYLKKIYEKASGGGRYERRQLV